MSKSILSQNGTWLPRNNICYVKETGQILPRNALSLRETHTIQGNVITKDGVDISQAKTVTGIFEIKPTITTVDAVDLDFQTLLKEANTPEKTKAAISDIRGKAADSSLETMFPELSALRGYKADSLHQWDRFDHSLEALSNLSSYLDQSLLILEETEGTEVIHRITTPEETHKYLPLLIIGLLFHDIASTQELGNTDHEARSADLFEKRIAAKLNLSREETQIIRDLIQQHALLNLDKPYNKSATILETESIRTGMIDPISFLKLLTVFTLCDMKALGRGFSKYNKQTNYSKGRTRLMQLSLTYGVLSKLLAENSEVMYNSIDQAIFKAKKEEIIASIPEGKKSLVRDHLDGMPGRYCLERSPQEILSDAENLQALDGWKKYTLKSEDGRMVFCHVFGKDRPGILRKAVTAFAAKGISIRSAEIYTRKDGKVIDIIYLEKNETNGTARRKTKRLLSNEEVAMLLSSPTEDSSIYPLFSKLFIDNIDPEQTLKEEKKLGEIESARAKALKKSCGIISIDRTQRKEHGVSIIKINYPDYPGLLYDILSAAEKEGINVKAAVIQTDFQKVHDVLFVTNSSGDLLTDDEFEKLRAAIKKHVCDK